jgi:hypothetical protein
MHEPPTPTELTLEALYRRIAELEADLSTTREVIQRLEHIAGLVRADEARRDREREEHVREELFSYDLNHPQEEE